MKNTLLFLMAAFLPAAVSAQTPEEPDTSAIALATEFSIPTAAAFTLLGNTPAQVTSPGFTKDVKLDYFLDGKTLKPNIAFQAQPVWLLGFQNISLQEYRNVSPVLRALSRLSVSVGTVQDNDSVSRLAYAGRITFEKDPMMDLAYTSGISAIHQQMVAQRAAAGVPVSSRRFGHQKAVKRLDGERLRLQRLQALSPSDSTRLGVIADSLAWHAGEIETLQKQLEDMDKEFNSLGKAAIDSFVQDYIGRNWARPKLDIGFGAANRYVSGASITSLGLQENGYGVWVNPSAGFTAFSSTRPDGSTRTGVKILATGIFRYTRIDDRDEVFYGGNLRFGTAQVNVFAEYTQLRQDLTKTRALAYGGAYRIGNKKLLQFGIRTNYDEDFSFKSLQPVVAIDWKLGRDALRDALRE